MKKALLTAFIFLLLSPEVKGQDIYEHILGNASRIVNSPTTSFTQNHIAAFKKVTLIYISDKACAENIPDRNHFLDVQAYCLSEFMTLLYTEVLENQHLNEDTKLQRLNRFTEATEKYPLFHDPDEATTLQFVRSGTELTPFSIDTDWEKALAHVRSHL